MSKYRFLDTEYSLNREEIIYEYNRLIEDIWSIQSVNYRKTMI